jgi:uncharacterized protein YecA (UPF0149 family)
MVHRVFRLSISPERAPEVRRVVDFAGRATLDDVHDTIQRQLKLDNDHLYAFYLSGRYFDRSSEYGPARDSSHDSRSVLFRLGLKVGQKFAYLFDFGDELRHTITVVSITDVEVPLGKPVLVESVGDAPPQYGHGDFDEDDEDDEDIDEDLGEEKPNALPEHLAEVAPLAEAVLALSERLDVLYEEDEANYEEDEATDETEPAGPPEAIVSLLRELSQAALELARALEQDEEALHELDEWSQERELLPRLMELPLGLAAAGELDSALAVARAFTFVAAEPFNGDIAIIFAESGKREEAIAQLESNLKQFPHSWLTAMKSGEAFEALGDAAAAEASYRRAMTRAGDDSEVEEASYMLADLLEEMGRFDELDALQLSMTDGELGVGAKPQSGPTPLAVVGRNDPCPCGSGKKYKKCHGA